MQAYRVDVMRLDHEGGFEVDLSHGKTWSYRSRGGKPSATGR
jgi:hypothetical protein